MMYTARPSDPQEGDLFTENGDKVEVYCNGRWNVYVPNGHVGYSKKKGKTLRFIKKLFKS